MGAASFLYRQSICPIFAQRRDSSSGRTYERQGLIIEAAQGANHREPDSAAEADSARLHLSISAPLNLVRSDPAAPGSCD